MGHILVDNIRIISVNIGGDISKRIKNIKKFIKKENPDILCLIETHTFYEDYGKIKGWFENKNYKTFYTATSQKEHYEIAKKTKILEIQNNSTLTPKDKLIQTGRWEANTMLHSAKYAGGIVVMVKTHLKDFFTETIMIPHQRGITLYSSSLEEGNNTFLHFIYGPPTLREAQPFWKEVADTINKKPGPKNLHYIIGDLNAHLNAELDSNGGTTKVPKGLKRVIQQHMLTDTFCSYNKNVKQHTFFRIEEERTISSRVDYALAPHEGRWHSPKIYKPSLKISRDHHPIGLTLNLTMDRPHTKRPPPHKTKKMDIKDLKPETIDKIKTLTVKTFDKNRWKKILNLPDENIHIQKTHKDLIQAIWDIAEDTIKVSEKSSHFHLKPLKKDKEIKMLEQQQEIITKAILAIPLSISLKMMAYKLRKINTRMSNKYKVNTVICDELLTTDPQLSMLRTELHKILKSINRDLEAQNRITNNKFIEKRVDEIRRNRCDNPGKFFARARPDSVFRSQQVWTVEYEEIKNLTNGNKKKVKVISSIPETVSNQVKKAWEKIFTSKKSKTTDYYPAFAGEQFKKIKEKIFDKDDALTAKVTQDELKKTINRLSSGTASGPDNVPNEILKIMNETEGFQKVFCKLLNACITQQSIPQQWKKANIYTIYKKGNPNDPLNYRPIALLCTTYKIYSTIITARLSTFLEDNKCLSKMQGGFRRDRPTFPKIWTLRNVIEHSLINDKELHVCYLDIQKAYDSVEYWALDLVLQNYGFSKQFRSIISDLCAGASCNVILPYGLSEDITITQGVRQGCPLSPMLFILFLEPLMLRLEDSGLGYKLENNPIPIPGGAYADDMVLHANTKRDLQKLLNICSKYFNFIGLELAVDGRDKSVYTNNTGIPIEDEEELTVKTWKDGKETSTNLPFYVSSESYKYLGLWINLDLNWGQQTSISNAMYNKYISYLYKKCFNASQTVEILNLVVFPAITYRMNMIKFPDDHIKKWDKQARNLMAYKLRENQYIGSNHWYLPNSQYGYNLFKLMDLQKICLVANYLNYAANFIDPYVVATTNAIFGESQINDQTKELLKKYKLEIVVNPTIPDDQWCNNPVKYFQNQTIIRNLYEAEIDDINNIIQEDNTIIDKETLQALFTNKSGTTRAYNHLKKEMCEKNTNTIKPHILKRLDRYPQWEFNPEDFFFDEELKGYEIYVDETLVNKKAGFGIHIKKRNQYNFYDRVEGEETLQNATYQGILHTLKRFPQDQPIVFIIDRKGVIDVMENFPTSHKKQQDSLHLDTLKRIQEELLKRTATVQFKHCYSHTNEKNHDEETLDSNLTKKTTMNATYGIDRTERYVEGNQAADKLADRSMEKETIHTPLFNRYQNRYLLQSTRKKTSKKNSFKGVINTRIRMEVKKTIRTEYQESVLKKDRYDMVKKYQTKISKYSDAIIRSKDPEHEAERKMMIRMIHGSLPTCNKINRLVESESNRPYGNQFYTEKYSQHANNGLCPCCNTEQETIQHLFVDCQDEEIKEIRDTLHHNVHKAIKQRHPDASGVPLPFFYTNDNTNIPPSDNWNNSLGNMGLIPTEYEKYIKTLFDEEQIHNLKYTMIDISKAIMKTNIDMWKHRCKKLYTTNNNNFVT